MQKRTLMPSNDLKYPIGLFYKPSSISSDQLDQYIHRIQSFPQRLTDEVSTLHDEQLDTPYRDGGWTVRQVVHHCADSHMNSFIRFKLALTEEKPVIKPYYEERWAELPDTLTLPVEHSLILLKGLHARWTALLKSLKTIELTRSFIHPGQDMEVALIENIALYAWHGDHHLAHITALKKRKNWK